MRTNSILRGLGHFESLGLYSQFQRDSGHGQYNNYCIIYITAYSALCSMHEISQICLFGIQRYQRPMGKDDHFKVVEPLHSLPFPAQLLAQRGSGRGKRNRPTMESQLQFRAFFKCFVCPEVETTFGCFDDFVTSV